MELAGILPLPSILPGLLRRKILVPKVPVNRRQSLLCIQETEAIEQRRHPHVA
jgi:hypothetical protein